MHKIKPGKITAGTIASGNAFSFMMSVKRTPAYSKQFLYDVLAMFKQLGILIHFLTLSCPDLSWEELSYIINKSKNLDLSNEKIKHLSHQERCNLLVNNPVLVAWPFQYKVEVFFKEIKLRCPLGKTKYYAISIEF